MTIETEETVIEEMTSIPITIDEGTDVSPKIFKAGSKGMLKLEVSALKHENDTQKQMLTELATRVAALTKELEDTKTELEETKTKLETKSKKTTRVPSTITLEGVYNEYADNYDYEMSPTLADYLTEEDMKHPEIITNCKKDLFDGVKLPTLSMVYTFIYEGYINGEHSSQDATITITPSAPKKAVQNPKDVSKIENRCDCVVWTRRKEEDNRCKTSGVDTEFGRPICKTHKKSLDKDRLVWNSNGGDYDTQVARFRDGYYDTFDESQGKSFQKSVKKHNEEDQY